MKQTLLCAGWGERVGGGLRAEEEARETGSYWSGLWQRGLHQVTQWQNVLVVITQ